MTLLMVVTLLGLFGSGPLSRASAGAESTPLYLEYDRFGRLSNPTELRIYVKSVQIEKVMPEPDRIELASDRLIYNFPVVEPNQVGLITFHLKPTQFGLLVGQVGLVEGETLNFNQFIYP
jgi:hypothetical protein